MDGLRAQRTFKASANNEHGGAMHERPQRQHQAVMLARRAADFFGEPFAHEVERGPGLMKRRRPAYSVKEHFVSVTMLECKLELAVDRVTQALHPAKRRKQFAARSQTQAFQDVVAIAEALVNRGRGGSGGLGDGAHGERFFSSARPQA